MKFNLVHFKPSLKGWFIQITKNLFSLIVTSWQHRKFWFYLTQGFSDLRFLLPKYQNKMVNRHLLCTHNTKKITFKQQQQSVCSVSLYTKKTATCFYSTTY